jgi:hypothetical protein
MKEGEMERSSDMVCHLVLSLAEKSMAEVGPCVNTKNTVTFLKE